MKLSIKILIFCVLVPQSGNEESGALTGSTGVLYP